MTETTGPNDRRAQTVAALGFVLQAAAFGALLGISIWKKSDAIQAVARLMVAALPIWVVVFLIFKQLRRVQAEELESAELKRAREGGGPDSIFEVDDEALLLERNRLRWMVQWMLPGTTVVMATILLIGHLLFWSWSLHKAFASPPEVVRPTQDPTMMMWVVVVIGLACFLYARAAIALSRFPSWRLLHAGATCMASNALACLGLVIALMAGTNFAWAEPLFACVVRVAMLVLGVELGANFILDFYRPRAPGIVTRPSFDSRLLGLVGEPGGIAKSIAEAVNYQFGFEVSSTWFYQLLQRWMFPIMVLTGVMVLLLSSIVVVDADEAAVLERFGRPVGEPQHQKVLEPGLHFKWPYPIDMVYRAPVKRMREMVVGEATQKDDDPRKPILWTEAHDYIPELMLLVASPRLTQPAEREPGGAEEAEVLARRGTESAAVSLLMVSVPIEYRIKDIQKYLYRYVEPEKLLEGVAYAYLSDYAAGVDIDQLMGPGRTEFNATFKKLLQDRLDELDVGVEIVFAGLRGAHPPATSQVANAFQAVVNAETSRAATITAAEGEARKLVISVAGTESQAKELDEAKQRLDELRKDTDADPLKLAEAEQRVDELLLGNPAKKIPALSGQVAAVTAEARAAVAMQIVEALTKVRAFATDVVAYEAAPELYKQRRMLEVFEGIQDIRKYLIVGDPSTVIIEYQTAEQGGLDRVLSEGLEKEKKRVGG